MDIAAKYDRAAARWDEKLSQLGYAHAYRQLLQPHTNASHPVLDVGTGTGGFASAWLSEGGSRDLTLLDLSSHMLAKARARLEGAGTIPRIVQSSLERFDPDTRFGTILVAHVIEHCADPADAFIRMASWLSPRGQLILVASKPHWCNWLIWLRYRHNWFDASQIAALAHNAGLTRTDTHDFTAGPPGRTSRGYIFTKPKKEEPCSSHMLHLK
mgnify:CR=1 FL=1